MAVWFPPTCRRSASWVYGYDGKWIGRSPVLIIHRDVTHKEILWWSVARSESQAAFREDLTALCLHLHPSLPCGAVSDGKPGMSALIMEFFHLSCVQRCLVHVVREVKLLLPKYSPLVATQALRTIAVSLSTIRTTAEQHYFFLELIFWEQEYGVLLKQRTIPPKGSGATRTWWYTHGNLRRAWRLLNTEERTLFAFLHHSLIPSTNNSLEGVNRHLHRKAGMGKGRQLSLMCWKLALSRITTDAATTKLWTHWKRRFSSP